MPETAAGRAYDSWRNIPTPDTATGRKVIAIHGSVLLDDVRGIEAEARALGRAEALAAVRAAVDSIGLLAAEAFYERPPTGSLIELLRKKDVLAAIDNLETP